MKECLTRDDNEPSDLGFGFGSRGKLEGKMVKDDSKIINLLTELLVEPFNEVKTQDARTCE